MSNILFISPQFFNYHIVIKKELESLGYNVFWYSDRPSDNFISKCLIRLNKNFYKKKTKKYINKIIEENVDKKIDYVFVIFGQSFSKEDIIKLKDSFKEAKFIYYAWDSSKNFPVIKEIYSLFDKSYSFDKEDCKDLDMEFLPLFYSNEYITNNVEYDCSIIMTIKPGKLDNLKMVLKKLPVELKVYKHLYIQSKLVYLYFKLTRKEFRKTKMSDFKYKRIDEQETNLIASKSKVVIDCQMKDQNGLTIRTFETLHLNKKLITTNKNIKEYDFYSPENIKIITENEIIEKDFFEKEFDEKYKLSNTYSLNSFVNKLLK